MTFLFQNKNLYLFASSLPKLNDADFFFPQIKQGITSMNSVSSAFYLFVTAVLKLPNFTEFIKV